jgi:sugar phosphate isomerase/epimerase
MLVPGQRRIHLTYCLNVHPGEALADVRAAVRDHAAAVRDLVAPGQDAGVGLRIANRASRELEDPAALEGLRSLLREHRLYAFTVNAFPFGAFHGAAVKTAVYRPDWRDPDRRAYTVRVARQLAALLPPGLSGSVSTVPGSYKEWIRQPAEVEAMVDALADVAADLDALRRESGREVHLGLEPEPDCFLESTDETVAFFEDRLLPRGSARIARAAGCTRTAAEDVLRRHVGVCFDTCHLALQFEDLAASVRRLAGRGIRISKVQLSAALRTAWSADAAVRLARFCDPVYLHQVKALTDGGRPVSRGDLENALRSADARPGEEWRVHVHVPLYFDGDGTLASTAGMIDGPFLAAALATGVAHFEIETYTFDVLPAALRQPGVDRSMAAEYRWVMGRWGGGRA